MYYYTPVSFYFNHLCDLCCELLSGFWSSVKQFFAQPSSATQRQYEAVRAIIVDKLSAEQAAAKFHYSANTLHSLMRDVRAGKLQWFPLSKKKGPQQRHTPEHIQVLVVDYRKLRTLLHGNR